jgi:sugar/nucleoside kinase (ribokinase family)
MVLRNFILHEVSLMGYFYLSHFILQSSKTKTEVIILITCVGMIATDIIAKPIDELPELGLLQPVDSIAVSTGGCAINASIDLAKLGFDVSLIGSVGDDFFGKFVLDELHKYNVNSQGVVVSPKVKTGASLCCIQAKGERRFLYCGAANEEFRLEDVDWAIIERSDIVFVGGTLLLNSFVGEPCSRLLKKSQELGKITALDTVYDYTARWMSSLRPCMPYIDYFMPSYDEAVYLARERDPEKMSDVFLSMGSKNIIIKLGKDGCFFKNSDGLKKYYPTYEFIRPVDTVGAGDAFCAGFLGGLSSGWTLDECIRFGNAVGTYCIMDVGASTGIKPKKDILAFVKKYEDSI